MNKTERNKTINKLVYKFAESLGYEVNMDETDVTFISDSGDGDNDISYRRSSHTICAFNWACDKTLRDEKLLDEYIDKILLMSDDELISELG
jgi:hypothetical protein